MTAALALALAVPVAIALLVVSLSHLRDEMTWSVRYWLYHVFG